MKQTRIRIRRFRIKWSAFTLIEIMIVVVIIGLIASIGTLAVRAQLKRAQIKLAQNYITGTARTALELYFTENGKYPTSDEGLRALVQKDGRDDEGYLEKLDGDPWKQAYEYKYPGDHGAFDLWSKGPDGQSGTEDDITSWPQ